MYGDMEGCGSGVHIQDAWLCGFALSWQLNGHEVQYGVREVAFHVGFLVARVIRQIYIKYSKRWLSGRGSRWSHKDDKVCSCGAWSKRVKQMSEVGSEVSFGSGAESDY